MNLQAKKSKNSSKKWKRNKSYYKYIINSFGQNFPPKWIKGNSSNPIFFLFWWIIIILLKEKCKSLMHEKYTREPNTLKATTIWKTNEIYQILWVKIRNIYNNPIQKRSKKMRILEKVHWTCYPQRGADSFISKCSTLSEQE
jgi:hypothetical protein